MDAPERLTEILAEYDAIVDKADRGNPEWDFVMRASDYRAIRRALSPEAGAGLVREQALELCERLQRLSRRLMATTEFHPDAHTVAEAGIVIAQAALSPEAGAGLEQAARVCDELAAHHDQQESMADGMGCESSRYHRGARRELAVAAERIRALSTPPNVAPQIEGTREQTGVARSVPPQALGRPAASAAPPESEGREELVRALRDALTKIEIYHDHGSGEYRGGVPNQLLLPRIRALLSDHPAKR